MRTAYVTIQFCSREPTPAELRTDAAVHVLGLVLAPIGGALLLLDASSRGELGAFASIAIYVVCALLMIACSAAYNMRPHCRHRPLLRRIDQAAIFAMIAGTYTPFTVLGLTGYWSWGLTAIVWSLALLGITAKLCNWSWPERLWIPLYLAISWLVVVAVDPLSETLPEETLMLIGVGGVIYTVGVVFHLWDRLKFATAVWHVFVLLGAGAHYAAVASVISP
ncbi:MAG: hemolysin III family protein [Rhodospirillaceae bacterium]|nr:hemolysin III family protein [Rhodospirillaceae bacterium]